MTTRRNSERRLRRPLASPAASRRAFGVLTAVGVAALAANGCSHSADSPSERIEGQSHFESISPQGGASLSLDAAGSAATGAGGSSSAPPVAASTAAPRTVEETDLYRLDGDRLFYLNGYRGLMVFDVADVDHPKLLGRSPLFGTPVEMIVRNGVATVVVADWYGTNADGSPFHGSIVRGIDANDPANIRILGDAKLGGWVRDTRVVGDVLYAVSEEWGWDSYYYGVGLVAGGSASTQQPTNKVVVSSVSFAGGQIVAKGRYEAPGSGGIFNVTPSSILFAHEIELPSQGAGGSPCDYGSIARTGLEYIDISDPGGNIVARGHLEFEGAVQGWGADNGRWNLDFADGKTAHALGVLRSPCGSPQGYVLATADFSNPDAPMVASSLSIDAAGWTPAARFDSGRMYLSPDYGGGYGSSGTAGTPIQVYDTSVPTAPKLAGSTSVQGVVWNFIPSGDRLFALGNNGYDPNSGNYGSSISLRYLDVSDAASPKVIGTSTFGEGWAWTPAAGTFKAFTRKADTAGNGLVVLPFSGWSAKDYTYNNGLQLIEFSPSTLRTAGAAKTRGWVERGIFVKNRVVSLSDLALTVVDYSVVDTPAVVAELTLARNVVNATPAGDTISQLSSDWWDNQLDHSDLRVLPVSQAEENLGGPALAELSIEGVNARVFQNGLLSYVVTDVRGQVDCSTLPGGVGARSGDGSTLCDQWHKQVQIVDLYGGTAVKRGKVALPSAGYSYYGGWGWEGCYYYNWWWGNGAVQVGSDALAFQLWSPQYGSNGQYVETQQSLFVVDLSDADAPTVASTRIITDPQAWWGDMRAVGNKLYTTHYEWLRPPSWTGVSPQTYDPGVVRYYLDQIDLSDRSHPVVGAKINVPGILVGGSETDPSILYTIDYRWYGDKGANEFDVLKIDGSTAFLQGAVPIPGWVGSTHFANGHAYMSVQLYTRPDYTGPTVQLYQIDLGDPHRPTAQASTDRQGWGWLLGIQGDRALVTSGWGNVGLDIYRLSDHAAPAFDQFVRTRGWYASSLARRGNQLFLASGYWGVQTIDLGN